MKINEKNLSAYASSPTPIDREGWLNKRGELNKSFQRRWFVLKANLLFYFDKKTDKEPFGVIILEGCTIELAEDDENFSFKIVFHGTGSREYILNADSQDSMEQWMKTLACASYDYMKLIVADLQRQVDEMEEASTSAPNELKEELGPVIPPRGQRYNPFNKAINSSTKTVQDTRHHKDAARNPEHVPRDRVTFRELHTAYGRKILADRNDWKQKKLKEQPEQEDLKGKVDLQENLISIQPEQDVPPLIVL